MNYRKLYLRIIKNAKYEESLNKRNRKNGIYYESHHILPKSMFPLWKHRDSNIVLLTAREHFFCHQLLVKIYGNKEMNNALWFMTISKNKHLVISSKEYEKIRKSVCLRGKNNGFFGKHHTEETLRKNAEWHHLHPNSKDIMDKIHKKNIGKHRTLEQRERQSKAALKRDNTKNNERIKKVKFLYEKYKNTGGKLVWNEFQKHYKEFENGTFR